MSDFFEDEEEEVIEVVDDFEEEVIEEDTDVEPESSACGMDARRKLEHMLEEKRLREELDDFVDY